MAKKPATNVTYIDLDAIVPDVKIVLKFQGEQHELAPVSVDDFIANTKMMQELGAAEDNMEKNFETIIDMLVRAFPSASRETFGKLTFPQLRALMNRANELNGTTDVVKKVEAEAAANPQ